MHISIVRVLDNQAFKVYQIENLIHGVMSINMIFVFTSQKNVEEKPQSLQLSGTNVCNQK